MYITEAAYVSINYWVNLLSRNYISAPKDRWMAQYMERSVLVYTQINLPEYNGSGSSI